VRVSSLGSGDNGGLLERSEPLTAAPRRVVTPLWGLGAKPAAAAVVRRLHSLGVCDLPRGPRAATRANHAGLTARQMEVVGLVVKGLPNVEIAGHPPALISLRAYRTGGGSLLLSHDAHVPRRPDDVVDRGAAVPPQ